MGAEAAYIDTFIKLLAQIKGPSGNVILRIYHDWALPPRDTVVTSPEPAGTGIQPEMRKSAGGNPIAADDEAELSVGEYIEVEGISPRSGFIHLFNLGTSGACTRLVPSQDSSGKRILAHRAFRVPSDQLLPRSALPGGLWMERGPRTCVTGLPERILAIITDEDIVLECEDLFYGLREQHARIARSGFSGPAEVRASRLFGLNRITWDYGLVALRVV